MSYEEALNIFGLYPGYTEAELKKVYRSLAKKYHTDINNSFEAQEKMRKINVAHDILKQNLGKNNTNAQKSNSNLEKQEYINKIKLFWVSPEEAKKYPNYLQIYITDINNIISNYIDGTTRPFYDYKTYFKISVDRIQFCYQLVKDIYFMTNNIIVEEVTEKIDYNCSFANFYQQLEYLNNKYNKVTKITNIIEKESEKFKLYRGYDNIINVIEYYKRKYSNRTTIIKYCYKESIIIGKFNEDIEKAFKEYFEMLANFKIVSDFITQNKDNIKFENIIKIIYEQLLNLDITNEISKIVFASALDFNKYIRIITDCLTLIDNAKEIENENNLTSKTFSQKYLINNFYIINTEKDIIKIRKLKKNR